MAGENAAFLFIRPPSDFRGGRFETVWRQPPMNLFYLASFLEKAGFACKVIDYEFEKFSEDGLEMLFSELRPSFVGISVSGNSLASSKKIASIAKKSGAKVFSGGAYSAINPKKVLSETGVDFCVIGEAEETLLSIARSSGKVKRDLAGTAFLGKTGRLFSKPATLPASLDGFGYPDRSLTYFRKYDSCFSSGIWENTAFITASRGCPYNCTFCISTVLHGKKWRARSVSLVLDEVGSCINAGYRHIQFDDDIFGFSDKWFRDFCRGIVKRGYSKRITWDYSTRADLTSKEKFRIAKEAGARKVCMGVESGSETLLKMVGKGESLERIRRAFSEARAEGLLTEAFFVLGFFGETKGTLLETERLLFDISPDVPVITLFCPFPGTEEHRKFAKAGLLGPSEIPTGFFTNSAQGQFALSSEKLVKFRDSLYRKYSFRPSFVLRTLSQARSLRGFYRLLLAGLSVALE